MINILKYKDENWLTEQYWGFNQSTYKIGKECNCDGSTIIRWMIKYDIPRRTLSQSIKISHAKFKGDNNPAKRPEVRSKLSGKNNPMWKGKRKINGYIFLKSHDHPFRQKDGYVSEHRLIAEESLRKYCPNHPALIEIDGVKYLRKDWTPHHINGIKDDNRWNNLSVMPKKSHDRFHTQGSKNPFYGKHHTEQTKNKVALSNQLRSSTSENDDLISTWSF